MKLTKNKPLRVSLHKTHETIALTKHNNEYLKYTDVQNSSNNKYCPTGHVYSRQFTLVKYKVVVCF